MGAISWPNGPDSMDESELKLAIDDIQARRISVGGAYRRLYFMPDFAVLWQIGRRKTAVALAGLYALSAVAIVTVVVAGSLLPVWLAIGILVVVGGVVIVADWAVVIALEVWVEEYNASLDQEIRRIMGRSGE